MAPPGRVVPPVTPAAPPAAERAGPGYVLVRALARLLIAVFYRRVEVLGAEHVPASGALLVAANHHNSVVDALLLLAVLPRRLRTLANAPLFRHPLIGPFLRLLGALPVHRRQESGDDPARNAALFAATTATLRAGGAILIFPEGRTQPEPALQELRTGAARMLLAAAGERPVTLLPVGLVFHQPGTFRAGRALAWIGAPLDTSAHVTQAMVAPEAAARALTDELAAALRAQIVEADDRGTLRLLELAEELWRAREPLPPEQARATVSEAARVAWLQGALNAWRAHCARAPERAAALRARLSVFAAQLERAGLAVAQLSRSYAPARVGRTLLAQGLLLLLGTPLALVGLAVHGLPYLAVDWLVRLVLRHEEEEATDKIALGLLLYPLAWGVQAWVLWRWVGIGALLAWTLALAPLGFFALTWRERLARVASEARAAWRFLRDRGLPARLRAERHALAVELAALAEEHAPPALEGAR